jgi:regulator of RNase E activity RraA
MDWSYSMIELTAELVALFGRLDACAVSNAVETFDRRLRNEGFADTSIRGLFQDLPPALGRAVTARIHCSAPPPIGRQYYDRTDWWSYILTVPPPRIVVVEDADERPGLGAFVGEVHANILKALGCVAFATNGSVRDVPAVRATGLQCLASRVSVSHAYVHIVEFGQPVTIGGLTVASGDVLYGDGHGLVNIPEDLVEQIPSVVDRMRDVDRQLIALCHSSQFSLETLRRSLRPHQ